jgi:hypothetical protein
MSDLPEGLSQPSVELEELGIQMEVVRDATLDIQAAQGLIADATKQMFEILGGNGGQRWPLKGTAIARRAKQSDGSRQKIGAAPDETFDLTPFPYILDGTEMEGGEATVWLLLSENIQVCYQALVKTLSVASEEEIAAARPSSQQRGT